MLTNVTGIVTEDAETERELLEGLRVIARVSSLCSQMSVEADLNQPAFFDMCSPNRMIGGPNPDGNYYLAMIRGDRRYRITGSRGTSAYLGRADPGRHRAHSAADVRITSATPT